MFKKFRAYKHAYSPRRKTFFIKRLKTTAVTLKSPFPFKKLKGVQMLRSKIGKY
ncbi:hypothetical protein GGTG_00983 [Gaeumannomyces tritici R3-111a-1]|uniref:Uncharacterized protein n=1 Tax=Gaeumannomyces tritici (strain R3-111a-1) TaxID=644352 RepID=J3NIA0_GAET3|nr:hypothetical protein GGTG_00983 [Gaeumannomyces tritici R3-111a-1]EJT80993.1 hypothetical protein GGTG_00983 [Gaeumannomyces tritici R3-111a-1]